MMKNIGRLKRPGITSNINCIFGATIKLIKHTFQMRDSHFLITVCVFVAGF